MEILHTYVEMSDQGESIMMFTIIVIGVLCLVGAGLLDCKKKKSGILVLVFSVAMLISLIYNYPNLPRDTYHEVNLDTLTDFDYRSYEIVSQKGKIVTIREVELIK